MKKNKLTNKGIVKDFSYLLSGRIVNAIFSFINVYILMKVLSVDSYGEYVYILSMATFLSFIIDFGIKNSYVSQYSSIKGNETEERKMINTFISSRVFIVLFVIAIFVPIFIVFYNRDFIRIWSYIVFGSVLYFIFESNISLLQSKSKFNLISKLMPIPNVISAILILTFVLLKFTISVNIVLMITFVSMIVSVVLLSILLKNDYKGYSITFDYQEYRHLISTAKWVFLYSVNNNVITRTDLFLLNFFESRFLINSGNVGIYSGASKIASFLPLITMSLTSVLLPKVSSLKEKYEFEQFIGKIKKILPYIFIIIIFGSVIGGYLIDFAFGMKYADSIPVFRMLIFSYGFSILANPIMLMFYPLKKANYLVIISTIQVMINIIGDFFIIPLLGAYGASFVTMIVKIIGFILSYLIVVKIISKTDEC